MPAENSARIAAGRLLLVDVTAGYRSAEDVDDMIAKIASARSALPATTKLAIVADWRDCGVFPPPVAERIPTMFRTAGAIERSAILHAVDQHTSVMQILRLIREANFPDRRVFTTTAELEGWMGAILDERERAALRTFLAKR